MPTDATSTPRLLLSARDAAKTVNPRPRNSAGPHRAGPSGEPIRSDCLYTWACLHTLLGWGSRTVAKARAEGLRVLAFGGRLYCKGADIIAFLDGHPLAGDQGKGGPES